MERYIYLGSSVSSVTLLITFLELLIQPSIDLALLWANDTIDLKAFNLVFDTCVAMRQMVETNIISAIGITIAV